MHVLWWLAPPAVCTLLAMAWAGWAGRDRATVRRDDSDAAMRRIERALAKPVPAGPAPWTRPQSSSRPSSSRPSSSTSARAPSHSVIVRPAPRPSSRS